MNINEVLKIKKLTEYNKYLFIGPHPDDIEFGCGALISKLKGMNKDITFVILTDGSAGLTEICNDKNKIKEVRKQETIASAKFLGVNKVVFIDFEDGGNYSIQEALEKLLIEVVKAKPEIIFAPDPLNKTECHFDHIKCGFASRFACVYSGYEESCKRNGVDTKDIKEFPKNVTLAHYFSDNNNYFEKVSKENVQDKLDALRLHVSQNSGEASQLVDYFGFKAKLDGFKSFKGLAESYQVLPSIYQHVYSHGIKPNVFSLLFKK